MMESELVRAIEKIESEEVFERILRAVARRGEIFRPTNYVWEILPLSLRVKGIVPPEDMGPEDLSPILVASFLEFGQILPIWVDSKGRVVEGRARAVFFGPSTKYLIHPTPLTPREKAEVRFTGRIPDGVVRRLAERIGVELWREEVG